MKTTSAGQPVDPYYGMTIPAARMGYLKFCLGFVLFGFLNALLHHSLWWTLLLWNLFWWGALSAIALCFFRRFLPDASSLVVAVGLTLLMLFNFGDLQHQFSAWLHLPFLQRFQGAELPFTRPFFPQVSIPLMILYLSLQIEAMTKRHWWMWAAMTVTQFLAFAAFPYATMMMAGITVVGVMGFLVSKRSSIPWRALALYAVASAAIDGIFLAHGSQAARTGAPGQYSLIHLQFSLLPHRIGGMWLLLAAFTGAMFLLRDISAEIKWTLIGLGLSNLLLLLGDVVFSETAVQVSHHAGYFVHLSSAILFTFLVSARFGMWSSRRPAWRAALAVATVLLLANGALVGEATFQSALLASQQEAAFTHALLTASAQASDLVIARSQFVDDDCGWVPLISPALVLYCRNAQVLLSPEQNQTIQRFRQALYLYFTGKDVRWVEGVLQNSTAQPEFDRLIFLGQVTSDPAERQKTVESIRTELLPILKKVEDGDPTTRAFFLRYRSILLIDNLAHPYFDQSRLTAYLRVDSRLTVGNLLVSRCSPAQP